MKNGISTRGSKILVGAVALMIGASATFAGTLIPNAELASVDNVQLVSPVKIESDNIQSVLLPTGGGHGTLVSDPNFIPTSGIQTWSSTSNWDSGTIPSGIDVAVSFPSLTAAELVNIDGGSAKTVGSFTLTNDSANAFGLLNGAAGSSLIFQVSSGTASLIINGTGNVVNTFGSSGTNLTVALNSTLDITINNTATTSVTGALSIATAMSGVGGVIKDGAGRVSFANATKTYTGSTVINAGVLRTSVVGEPTGTSSVTVNSGGELLLSATATGQVFQFGSSAAVVITLNGDGTSGSGALACDNNAVALETQLRSQQTQRLTPRIPSRSLHR